MSEVKDKNQSPLNYLINWTILLAIFSVITVIGNYVGYKHPIGKSLVGMAILSAITIVGMLCEKYIPVNISSIVYISLIGLFLALPGMPTASPIVYYVSNVELLAIVTVFLAYVGIGIGKDWDQFKEIGWRGAIVTVAVITGTYIGSALIAHIVLMITGTPI